jgi:outer membrane protein OmpA-like peptidoglycan-associated protein/tetratricopeptide (TPR) repeat protein
MKKYYFSFLLFVNISFLFSQDDENSTSKFCKEIDNKQAIKLYEKGTNKKKYKKPERLQFLRECLQLEPDFVEANFAMAQEIIVHCKLENKPFTPALPFLYKVIANCPDFHSNPYYYIGFDYYEKMKNDSAIKYLELFLNFKGDDPKKFDKDFEAEIYQAKEMIKYAKKENELKKKVVPFNPVVVKDISTPQDEYLASLSPDDQYCYFVRKEPIQSKDLIYQTDKEQEVFMVAIRDNKTGMFDKGSEMPPPFNTTDDNQGGCSITVDNKHLFFAMMRYEGGAQPNCDIYVSDMIDGEWKPYRKVPNINHPVYWDSQPSVSADGNTLYFASDRPGGYGGTDIYVSYRNPKTGEWSVPQNLGPKINTPGHERTPFIHSDSETLYFSSDGHFGFGGFDIFYSRKNEKGEWTEPENLGSPINTTSDELGFFVSSNAKHGYFCAYAEGPMALKGVGKYDLFMFELYKDARPNEVTILKGQLMDSLQNPVSGKTTVEINYPDSKSKTYAAVDSSSGEFVAAINLKKTKGQEILINVKKDGYAFSSQVIKVPENANFYTSLDTVKIITDSVKPGKAFVINNLYYKTNSAEIEESSKKVLIKFAEYLKENPKLVIEIRGHTDNIGNPKDNEALSLNRAYSVKEFLEKQGVDGKRIQARGFGASRPIASNATEQGRAKNRRTEFYIISIK